MTGIRDLLATGSLAGGLVFCTLAVAGFLRMPDPFSRLHALGKAFTLGVGGCLLSLILVGGPRGVLKGIATLIFLVVTAPMVTHAIGRAALRAGTSIGPDSDPRRRSTRAD